MGHRQIREFFTDHTFMEDGNKDVGMTWHLKGERLVLVFPDLPATEVNGAYPGPGTSSIHIVSLRKNELITANDSGRKFVFHRLTDDTQEERDRAAVAARADEEKLNGKQ